MLIIYTDGASSGNPGPMGIGVAVYKDHFCIEQLSEYIGVGTNNVAEYTALIRALETAHHLGEREIHVKSDSQLLIRQMNNEYKVKDLKLRELRRKINALCIGLEVHFEHIPREKNSVADKLSKQAVKKRKSK